MATTRKTESKTTEKQIVITAPNFQVVTFHIIGTAPYVGNKFSEKKKGDIHAKMEAGSSVTRGKKRDPKDFDEDFRGAMHVADEGWYGIPATAFRNALISACRVADFKMTHAKMSVFVLQDGWETGQFSRYPLVKFLKGEPEYTEFAVRNASGVMDLRPRPMWREGWEMMLRVSFDADQFSAQDVANLVMRAGLQVGVGAGRPDSSDSAGCGWGTFALATE